ncbi:hypothetical protein QBC39DRAFT_367785 [Podospora conica]|nr:hypothetical protein QBC39DRAFT_367785 [Schizothecium conicum]
MEDKLIEPSTADHLASSDAFRSEHRDDVLAGHTVANLQQQLHDKTDEVNQLRSLLESGGDTDAAMLQEQLRLVERECLLWRTRAEVAEKRVATFKRLAARVKAMKVGEAGTNHVAEQPGLQLEDDEAEVQDEGMRRVEQWLEQDRRMDSSGDHTEGTAVVAARIRQSLRAMEEDETTVAGPAESHYDSEDEGSVASMNATRAKRPPPPGLCRQHHRYRNSGSEEEEEGGGISGAVASMWVKAEGMLVTP